MIEALQIGSPSSSLEQSKHVSPSVHLKYLDGLRGLCALYVVAHHSLMQFDDCRVQQLLMNVFKYGHAAVDIFIVVSGFCLMLPLMNTGKLGKMNVLSFLKRRVKRIIPTYYFAALLSMFLIYTLIGNKTGSHWDISIPINKWDIFTHFFLIQDLFYDTNFKVNHVFWSIAVEWKIYFVFPVIVILITRIGLLVTFALVTSCVVIVYYFLLSSTYLNSSPWGINPHYYILFLMGMISAYIVRNDELKTLLTKFPIHIVAGLFLIFWYFLEFYHKWMLADLSIGFSCLLFLVCLSTERLINFRKILSIRPIVFIGSFAYSLYLVHAPLLQIACQYFIKPLKLSTNVSAILLFIIGIPVITIVSYCFFLVAEKPFISKGIRKNLNLK